MSKRPTVLYTVVIIGAVASCVLAVLSIFMIAVRLVLGR